MPDLPADPPLSYGTRVTKKRAVSWLQFGDGRSQRANKGTNPVRRTFSLVWEQISDAHVTSLDAFFDGLGGIDYFGWTPPGEATACRWVEQGIDRSYDEYGSNTYTVTAEQVYDDE